MPNWAIPIRLMLIAAFVSLSKMVWQHSHSQLRCLSARFGLTDPHTWQALLDGAHRSGKDRDAETVAEQFQCSVRSTASTDGIHVDADILPCAIVADGDIPNSFCAGTRKGVPAGPAVTDGANFAGAHLASGGL